MCANPSDSLEIIKSELALLSVQLDSYRAVFLLEQDKRNELVKDSAPGFFALHQMAMVESILMRVSRLMDPEKSVGQDNASFKRLVQFSPFNTHAKDWTAIHEEWNDGGKFGRVRHLRNKFLAHNDLTLWKCRPPGQSWIPISPDDFQCLIDLAKALWALLRKVYRAEWKSDLLPPDGVQGEHPTKILRCLAGARFLSELVNEDGLQAAICKLPTYIDNSIGRETAALALNAPTHWTIS
jgi:hypothetical protein